MVVVEADQLPGDYWIRIRPATGCNGFNQSLDCDGSFNDTCSPFDVRTGILRYNTSSGPGTDLPTSEPWDYARDCTDEP